MNEVTSVCLERLRMLAETCHTESGTTEKDGSDTHKTEELPNTESSSSPKVTVGSVSPPGKWEVAS